MRNENVSLAGYTNFTSVLVRGSCEYGSHVNHWSSAAIVKYYDAI